MVVIGMNLTSQTLKLLMNDPAIWATICREKVSLSRGHEGNYKPIGGWHKVSFFSYQPCIFCVVNIQATGIYLALEKAKIYC